MHRYETLFVLTPDIPEAQVRETMDRVRRLIEGMEGQVTQAQDWGMRDLAYPIRKHSRGNYALVQYTARPEVVRELERTLKLADEVLRYVSTRVEEAKKAVKRARRTRPTGTPGQPPVATPAEEEVGS
jgi:small subunit ribosomal protein S6